MIPLNMELSDIPEISSTSSSSENRSAFYKKLRSRKYKCILTVMMITFSFVIVMWLAVLAKASLVVFEAMELDRDALRGVLSSFNNITGIVKPRILS